MNIERISIRNYRLFQDAVWRDIPPMCVLVGPNGSGKSTFFDVFSFLQDSLTHNVTKAINKRGGYREVVSRGQDGPIEIEIKFREQGGRLATYHLQIGEERGRAIVQREILKLRRGSGGRPWHFLDFSRGQGEAITNEAVAGSYEEMERESQELDGPDILAIKGLGQFQRFRVVSEFRKLIDNWQISDFHIQDARPSQDDGIAEHLSRRGENLALVAQHLYENDPALFERILHRMEERVPGVTDVNAARTEDGRIVLRFQDGAFKDPFVARYVSDGTIKMFAYLVLLYDPNPFPLLAVEEPENQLYPELMDELCEEFRDYARRGGQVFVSTHSPDFLNGVKLEEIYWLEKQQGFSTVHHAIDNPLLRGLIAEGDQPGVLWKQGLFMKEETP